MVFQFETAGLYTAITRDPKFHEDGDEDSTNAIRRERMRPVMLKVRFLTHVLHAISETEKNCLE